ncbi:MAG TPA: glycosyltransferase family 4 protein [Syntrophales bacterium]|nr:glycosyltransferase family 4 protein [Syntrophales bacterium]
MKKEARVRIGIVVPKYGLVGGGEEHVAQLTNRISQSGEFDVHLFANQWANVSDTVSVHKIPILSFPKFLTTSSFAYFVEKEAARMPLDLIHTHDRIYRADLSTLHWIPHRIWVRDVRKKRATLFDRVTMRVEHRLAHSCRMFAAVSHLAREKFLEEYPGIDPDRIRVVHPGVDLEQFSKRDRGTCRHEIRQQYGLTDSDTVVLFVSMNYDIKGLDYLMGGIAQFRGSHPGEPLKLLIVGRSGTAQYDALARTLGIHRDILYTGVIPHERIAEIYLASDLFAMPSRFDTFGLTVVEAMAAGLPVIVSTNVGARDLVTQGLNGFIVDNEKHAEQIGHALSVLINRDVRRGMSQEAWKTASRHGWEVNLERYLELYRHLLEVKPGRS